MRRMEHRTRAAGFTLMEMLVVVIIVVLLAGVTVALMGQFLRGQGIRSAANLVSASVMQTKQSSAETRLLHFLKFENQPDGVGLMKTLEDTNGNKLPDTGDREVDSKPLTLPKGVYFKQCPDWIAINPSGYTTGFLDVAASTFEAAIRENREAGEIILAIRGQSYIVCMDIDPSAGKIRKWHFLTGIAEAADQKAGKK